MSCKEAMGKRFKLMLVLVILLIGLLILLCYRMNTRNHITLYYRRVQPADQNSSLQSTEPMNILFVFTGRWQFLRVQFLYVFKNLRENGGVIDQVYYMMAQYDVDTHRKLISLTESVNKALNRKVVEMHYLDYEPGNPPKDPFQAGTFPRIHYEIFAKLVENPHHRYFKLDDDIVYIHPGTFESMLENKDSSQCFMHFANTVGNWRCSWIHQRMGLFDNALLNPKKLEFGSNPAAECGWWSAECTELGLRTFIDLYNNDQLHRYHFDGLELTIDRSRFSIHLFLFDKDLIDVQAVLKSGRIINDDEKWWTEIYSREVAHPNCVVGQSLVVHFSYSQSTDAMLKLGLLKEFETIALKEFDLKMSPWMERTLEF